MRCVCAACVARRYSCCYCDGLLLVIVAIVLSRLLSRLLIDTYIYISKLHEKKQNTTMQVRTASIPFSLPRGQKFMSISLLRTIVAVFAHSNTVRKVRVQECKKQRRSEAGMYAQMHVCTYQYAIMLCTISKNQSVCSACTFTSTSSGNDRLHRFIKSPNSSLICDNRSFCCLLFLSLSMCVPTNMML